MAQATSADHRAQRWLGVVFQAARLRHRGDQQRRLVADSAGRVLVDSEGVERRRVEGSPEKRIAVVRSASSRERKAALKDGHQELPS